MSDTERYEHNDLTVVVDKEAGYRHLEPLPSEEELAEIYRNKFGGDEVKEDFKETKQADEDYWRMAVERRLRTYREVLHDLDDPRILDVGCGTGNILSFFRENGWDVQGIEPSEHFFDILEAEDIPYVPELVEDMTEDDWQSIGTFDVVNLSMVLEHIRNPGDVVGRLADKALRDGGILTIECPNDFNPLQETAVEMHDLPRWWIHELHLNYFDFDSLEDLVRRQGLTLVLRECQFPMEFFLLFGDVYIGEDNLGRECHLKRVSFEKNLHESGRQELLQTFYRALAECGLGRTAIIHSQKLSNEK